MLLHVLATEDSDIVTCTVYRRAILLCVLSKKDSNVVT